MELVFCHGLESGPHGRKYHAMKTAGLPVVSPDFQGQALAARVEKLVATLGDERPVLVGSSYGGLVAVCASAMLPAPPLPGILLCAPALGRAELPADRLDLSPRCPVVIIHGKEDEVVPIEVSRRYAGNYPELVELIEVDDDHSLAASVDRIVSEAERMLVASRSH
jgi:pimeloyl-ACP methyl ester carboxylesterase